MRAFIKFNKGLMNGSIHVRLWLVLLTAANLLIPLFFLSHLEAWVEEGQAPDMMIGYHAEGMNPVEANVSVPDRYDFSRPHYPYPLQARYKGSGDPNDYRNFEPVEPRNR